MVFDSSERPRICLIGPMLGRNPGIVTTQGEILADLLRSEGYEVVETSSIPGRLRRLADILRTVVKRRRDYDLIWLQVFGGPSFVIEEAASALGRRLGKPIVMTLRGGAMPGFMARFPRWSRWVMKRAAVLTVPSEYLHRAIAKHGFESKIIPNVVRCGRYPFRQRRDLEPKLLWMRTFHPLYNPILAVQVLARVRQDYPNATMVMAGQEKGTGEETRALAKSLGLADAIVFPGFLDMDGKARELDAADIFLNTNNVDNTPVSVIEACAAGLPVVATNVGGLSDLLTNEKTGLLVPPNDPEAMAQAVIRLFKEPNLAEKLSSEGRQLALACSWDNVLPQWERVFGEALGTKNHITI